MVVNCERYELDTLITSPSFLKTNAISFDIDRRLISNSGLFESECGELSVVCKIVCVIIYLKYFLMNLRT